MKAIAALTVVLVVSLGALLAGQSTGITSTFPVVQAANETLEDARETVSSIHIDKKMSSTVVDWLPMVFLLVGLEGGALYFGKSNKGIACFVVALVWLLIIGSMMMQ